MRCRDTAAFLTLQVRVVVRLCTDEDAAVSFWNQADAEAELALDVLDDLKAEAREVCTTR